MAEKDKTSILFVDDEPQVLSGLRRMLRRMRNEWDMEFAPGGAEALELMARREFDVLVTDMRMPGMNGAELLAEVQARHPRTVRFVLSGQSDQETILRSIGTTHQFLAKPCDAEELRQTIHRAFALRSVLANPRLLELVSGLDSLPSLPEIYLRIQELIRTDDASLEAVGKLVEQDVGMSAKVLQLVNSAFFGLRQPAATVTHAVAILGLDILRALTLAVHVFDQAPGAEIPGLDLGTLQEHSLAVGTYARDIARCESVDSKATDDSYLAGLLHDAGLMVLAVNGPDLYRRVVEEVASGAPLLTAERDVFGATHADVGAYVLGIWGLPDPVVEAAAFHHEPGRCPTPRFAPLAAVHVADVFDPGPAPISVNFEGSRLDEEFLASLDLLERVPVWREKCRPFPEPEARS